MSHLNRYALWLSLSLIGCGQAAQESESKRTNGGEVRTAFLDHPDRPVAQDQAGPRPARTEPRPEAAPVTEELSDFSLTLGSYNLLRLGYGDKDTERMAALILKADYDLFGAVEIMRPEAAEELLVYLQASGNPWEMKLSKEPAGEFSYKEYFAFYYRTDRVAEADNPDQFCNSDKAELQVENACFARDLRLDDGKPDFEREPFVGHFEVEGRLVTMVAMHVYYGDRDKDSVERRRHEMQGLLRVVDDIENATPETDVFVVGDFNLVMEHDGRGLDESIPHDFFKEMIGLIDVPTTIGYSNYDNIFYLQSNDLSWKNGSAQTIVDFEEDDAELRTDYKENVSDHFPVKADFSWSSR